MLEGDVRREESEVYKVHLSHCESCGISTVSLQGHQLWSPTLQLSKWSERPFTVKVSTVSWENRKAGSVWCASVLHHNQFQFWIPFWHSKTIITKLLQVQPNFSSSYPTGSSPLQDCLLKQLLDSPSAEGFVLLNPIQILSMFLHTHLLTEIFHETQHGHFKSVGW